MSDSKARMPIQKSLKKLQYELNGSFTRSAIICASLLVLLCLYVIFSKISLDYRPEFCSKADAKVYLFFQPCKFFEYFFREKFYFLHPCTIFGKCNFLRMALNWGQISQKQEKL